MSFSLILNSAKGLNLGPLITNGQAIVEYNIHWNSLSNHKGKFSLTCGFHSKAQSTTLSVNAVHTINANWGAMSYAYKPTSFNGLPASNTIGTVKPLSLGLNGDFNANATDSVPVILSGLPTQNQFLISMITISNNTTPSSFDADYILMLYFEAI